MRRIGCPPNRAHRNEPSSRYRGRRVHESVVVLPERREPDEPPDAPAGRRNHSSAGVVPVVAPATPPQPADAFCPRAARPRARTIDPRVARPRSADGRPSMRLFESRRTRIQGGKMRKRITIAAALLMVVALGLPLIASAGAARKDRRPRAVRRDRRRHGGPVSNDERGAVQRLPVVPRHQRRRDSAGDLPGR